MVNHNARIIFLKLGIVFLEHKNKGVENNS